MEAKIEHHLNSLCNILNIEREIREKFEDANGRVQMFKYQYEKVNEENYKLGQVVKFKIKKINNRNGKILLFKVKKLEHDYKK